MRTALALIGIVASLLVLPALTILAFVEGFHTPLVMCTIAVTALTACAFIIAGEEERNVSVIGWIAIAVAAGLVYAAIETVTDSTDSLPAPAVSILLPLGVGALCGRFRRKVSV
jgi:hypothetical protein